MTITEETNILIKVETINYCRWSQDLSISWSIDVWSKLNSYIMSSGFAEMLSDWRLAIIYLFWMFEKMQFLH